MASLSLISCIMPTRNRRSFINQAIWYFLRQDYPQKELVIVDDGEDSVSDLVPADERIRYFRINKRTSLGAKRNLACELSRGDVIAHWDDDDWMADNRLSLQAAHLRSAGSQVCGVKDLLHYRIQDGEAWLYQYPAEERPWAAGCTLMYQKSAWPKHHFPEINAGEDSAFLWQMPSSSLSIVPDSGFYFALIHSGNTGMKNLKSSRWRQRPLDEVIRRISQDRDFYVALRNGGSAQRARSSHSIATGINVGSFFDVCREAAGLLLPASPTRWEPYNNAALGPGVMRGIPDVDTVTENLRWVASHRAEAREMGRAASAWVLKNRDVRTMGPAMPEIIESHVNPPRALRRIRSLWVPSWKSPCGIAEYTAHLVENMSNVRVTNHPPDLTGVRLLHIQHENCLLKDPEISHVVREAHIRHIPVIVTEHSLQSAIQAWEGDADVLVTHTTQGADHLRSHWPAKCIEHIPHGCPTWFPPRKTRRGRVIGAFGFLERHKGFRCLLDLLRVMPDTELLMFSHAKSPELDAQWEANAQGLPVRRIKDFLSSAEAARRLAAEADILVYWYNDIDLAPASGAVRVGLATGVPVLTSPTRWFADLQEATYQPQNLIVGVQRLFEDVSLRERLTASAREYCHENSWSRTAERHLALWRRFE
jgi:glycosyltransferase involved in cell wall biosynthesis